MMTALEKEYGDALYSLATEENCLDEALEGLSLAVSAIRQLVVLLPAAFLLSLTGRLELVWLAFPIAEIFSMLTCIYFNRKITREVIAPLAQPVEG